MGCRRWCDTQFAQMDTNSMFAQDTLFLPFVPSSSSNKDPFLLYLCLAWRIVFEGLRGGGRGGRLLLSVCPKQKFHTMLLVICPSRCDVDRPCAGHEIYDAFEVVYGRRQSGPIPSTTKIPSRRSKSDG